MLFRSKEQADGLSNKMRVWFYASNTQNIQYTDDITHVFDDTTNQTITGQNGSQLQFSNVVAVTPESLTDPGNGDPAYETLNALNKKHYTIVFQDGTVVGTNADNINILVNANITASGETRPVQVSQKVRINDTTMKVWFTSYDVNATAGKELDNSFIRSWSIERTRVDNLTGNVFVRNWYISKSV